MNVRYDFTLVVLVVFDQHKLINGTDHGKKKCNPVWGLYSGDGSGYTKGSIPRVDA